MPMQVQTLDGYRAWCVSQERAEWVDLALVGPQPEGTWLLVYFGAAREVLTPEAAKKITKALEGLANVMTGRGIGDAFADLEARTPELPPHLEAARRAGASSA